MIVQFLIYAFGIPSTLILFNMIAFAISKKLERSVAIDFEEITQNWLTFFEHGIPVPADYRRVERPFVNEAVLVRPLLQRQNSAPSFFQLPTPLA